jgi:HlyD family secretion protein
VPNAALRFRPERNVLAAIQDVTPPSLSNPDERLLWMSRQGKATPVVVRIGVTDGTYTELVDGPVRARELAVTEAALDASGRGGVK